jgi:hypothetical protein
MTQNITIPSALPPFSAVIVIEIQNFVAVDFERPQLCGEAHKGPEPAPGTAGPGNCEAVGTTQKTPQDGKVEFGRCGLHKGAS